MELRHIKYFIAVAEEKNAGRAAARLFISQPPLTRQIQKLEENLGVKLFNRTPKGMELTEAGELFLVEARNINSLVEQATERTQRAGEGKLGRLDIAIFGSGILDVIPKLLLNFRDAYPDVNVVLHTMEKSEQIEALRQRRISVGFNRIVSPLADINTELVMTENLLLAVNVNNPLAEKKSIPFKMVADESLILYPTGTRPNFIDKVLSLCHDEKFVPHISQEVGDAVTGIALVASGFGVCLVPQSATVLSLPNVVYKKLTSNKNKIQIDLSCIYRADEQSPILSAFLGIVRDYRMSNNLNN